MTDPIGFDPYLGWVDVTDPNSIPAETRVIGASDLLRYENLGKNTKTFSEQVLAQIAALNFEPPIAAGTTAQYRRGDKTWATLDKAAVGLAAVDNTADADKPVSTAQAAAIGAKLDATARGAANGVAPLDASGFVPAANLRRWIGTVTVSVSASPGGTADITFPVGRFTAPPRVFLTKQSGALAKYIPYLSAVSATGCTVGIYSGDGTDGTGSVVMAVEAVLDS